MKLISTKLDGVFVIENNTFKDDRGLFVKTFSKEIFTDNHLSTDFKESFYSISKKNVLRGMHIQLPPWDASKLVYVTSGGVLDAVLDIRTDSPTYGQHISVELSADNGKMIYMPAGCVHGFLSLEDNTCAVYLQTATYSKDHDTGIRYDSFGMDWKIENPILSKRDQKFQSLADFKSPFIYKK